jgi:hypothetical protein
MDRKAAEIIEAKKAGSTLTGVEWQAAKYTLGLAGDGRVEHAAPIRL